MDPRELPGAPPSASKANSLLQAANAATAALETAGATQAGVIQTFLSHLDAAGFRAHICLLDPAASEHIFALSGPDGKLQAVELYPEQSAAFRQLVESSRLVILPEPAASQSPHSTHPTHESPLSERALCAALRWRGQAFGCLELEPTGLTLEDLPAVESCARQIAFHLHAVSRTPGQPPEQQPAAENLPDRETLEASLRQRADEFAGAAELAALHAENARLLEAERRGRQEAETLRQAADALASLLKLDEVLEMILVHLKQVVHYDSASILLLENGRLLGVACKGFIRPEAIIGQEFPLDNPLVQAVWESGRPLILPDAQEDPRFEEWAAHQVRGWAAAPLLVHGQQIGVLSCDSRQVAAYGPKDAELIQAFANQAAVAIENARLFEAERTAREQAETLREVARALSSSLQLDEVLRLILGHLERILTFDTASVILLDENGRPGFITGLGYANQERTNRHATRLLSGSKLLRRMTQDLEPVILSDVRQCPDWVWIDGAEHVRSFLGVPIVSRNKPIGVAMVDHTQVGFYQESHQHILQLMAQHMAIAIENARLFEAERAQLLLAQTLQQVGVLLTAQLSLNEVLENILDLLGRVIKFDSVSIQLLDQEGFLELAAGRGFPDFEEAYQTVHETSPFSLANRWPSAQAIVIPDTYHDERWVVTNFCTYIRSWIGAPLLVRGRFIGCLNVDSRTVNAYSPEEGETVLAFANQAAIAIENARLFEAEHTARERAEALRDATRIIGSTLSLEQVLEAVLEQIARVVPYDTGGVYLIQDGKLRIEAWRGYDVYYDPDTISNISIPVGDDSIVSRMLKAGRVEMVPDIEQEPGWQPTAISSHIRSWIGVPLQVRDETTGLFSLDRASPGGFTEEEMSLAQAFAVHASAAIENARLFETEGRRAAELEAVRQASLSLTNSLELPQVLNAVIRSTLGLLPEAHNGHIFLYSPEGGGRLTFGAALLFDGTPDLTWKPPHPGGLTYTVARQGEPLLIDDLRTSPFIQHHERYWAQAIISMPLKIGQRVVGVMNIAYRQPRQFSSVDLRLLRLLGDQAAIAIENARLFEQAATERRHLGLLYDITRAVTASLDAGEVLERALELTSQELGGSVGQAFLFETDKHCLSLRALYGHRSSPHLDSDHPLLLNPGQGLAGWVALHRQEALVDDLDRDSRWFFIDGLDDDVSAAISAPILYEGRVLGVMTVLHREAGSFSEDHLTLLVAICRQIGLALSNASRYQQVQRRLAEITLIQNLAQAFTQRLDFEVLLQEVVDQLSRRLGYPQVEVYLREDDEAVLHAYCGIEQPIQRFSIEQGIIGRTIRTAQASLVLDISQDEDFLGSRDHVVSEMAVPIFAKEQVIGAINIQTHEPGQLSPQDGNLIEVLAGQISIAVENAGLYERVRQHAEDLELIVAQRTAELTELYKLSQEISYQLSYDELLHLVLQHLRTAIQVEFVGGCLVSGKCDTVSVSTCANLSPAAEDQIRQFWAASLTQCGQPGFQQQDLRLEILADEGCSEDGARPEDGAELAGAPFSPDSPPIGEFRSLIYAPLFVDQMLAGLLIAGSEAEDAFGPEQARLLNTFANQAAAAVQRLQAVLAAQQKHLESLVENLPVGALLFDPEFNLLVANPLGREIFRVLNPDNINGPETRLGSRLLKDLLERHANDLQVEITLEGPPRRIFSAQLRPVGDERRQLLLTVREITQERENQARIQSQERLATVGQLAAGIAHDFNNIMAAILVYADLLSSDMNIPLAGREKLHIIQQQVQRATSLIRQILDFSRRSIMEQSALDLLPFVKELDNLLGRILPETIQVKLRYQPGVYRVSADPTRLQQVFMNLALNARDAMPGGGVLQFDLKHFHLAPGDPPPQPEMPAGDWVCVTVSDTGVGVSPEVREHIFEPFFTTKPVGQGTGLGLAQVYGIVRQHEGFIDVKSSPGEGATFSIYLPELKETFPRQLPKGVPAAALGNQERIMVVEDNVATREALQALLETHNFTVYTAYDGQDALDQIEQFTHPVSLVVSDIVMPRMGGMALYRALQQRWPQTKLLFITGHPLDGADQALLEQSSIPWLQKPFSVQEFTGAVRALLDEA